MNNKTIKAWAILKKSIFPEDKEYGLCITLNSLVKNYAIFEDRKIAQITKKFAEEINIESKYKVVPIEIKLLK